MFKHVLSARNARQWGPGFRSLAMAVSCAFLASSACAQSAGTMSIRAMSPGVMDGDSLTTPVAIDLGAVRSSGDLPDELTLRGVPLADGSSGDFEMSRFQVFTNNANLTVTGDGDTTSPLKAPDLVFYRGEKTGDPSEVACLSVENGSDVKMFVLNEHGKSSVIDKAVASVRTRKGMSGYFLRELQKPNIPIKCDVRGIPGSDLNMDKLEQSGAQERVREGKLARQTLNQVAKNQAKSKKQKKKNKKSKSTGVMRMPVVQMMIDVDYEGYLSSFHSNTGLAASYLANILAIDSLIYQRDIGVAVQISNFNVWTTQDPMSSVSQETVLTRDIMMDNWQQFVKSSRPGYVFDAAFLSSGYNFGGLGYLGGLCTADYRVMMGGTLNYNDGIFSTYVYDITLVAHELGHLCGTNHTHCYNPPIDCCFAEEGCTYCTAEEDQPGTIMSYCSVTLLYFHPRCADVMKGFLKKATCLDTFVNIDPANFDLPDFDGQLSKVKIKGSKGLISLQGTLKMTNIGARAGGAGSYVTVLLSSDRFPSVDDQVIASIPLKKDIKAGGKANVKIKGSVAAASVSGYHVLVILDAYLQIPETNEYNNLLDYPIQ